MVYKTETRLSEMNFGCWEGQRWDAIPKADYARWMADFFTVTAVVEFLNGGVRNFSTVGKI